MKTTKDFEYFIKKIDGKYKSLEFNSGWRFSYGPKQTFYKNNGILIVGTNPGIGEESKHKMRNDIIRSNEKGNAYLKERWGSNNKPNELQKQLIFLFDLLAKKMNVSKEDLINSSFTSNIIPFRSNGIRNLPKTSQVVLFSRSLWSELLQKLKPKLIIAIGNNESLSPYSIIKNIYLKDEKNVTSIKINWGKISIKHCALGNKNGYLIGIPHLSHFKFINRDKSKNEVNKLVNLMINNL